MAKSNRGKPMNWGNKQRYGEFEIMGAQEGKPRLLGQGSFGKTYEAVRTDTVAGGIIEERVAVKVLNPTLLTTESRRFQVIQELVALTKFKHSNLIHYIRCGEEEGEVFYAMELCRGGDLTRLLRRYQILPEKVVALIGLQVATGLREVHMRHRLVHRDIKPSNIMLVDELEPRLHVKQLAARLEEQEGLCRIVDFGLVSFSMDFSGANQKFVGSPMYASPEQINEEALDGRSDIYSLGMTLWYLLQGKGPLLDDSGHDLKGVREAMQRHVRPEEHEPNLPPHLSPAFRRILAKMVAKRPEERYATAADVQSALRDYLREQADVSMGRLPLTRLAQPLDSAFELFEPLPSNNLFSRRLATSRKTGKRSILSVIAGGESGHSEADALVQHICELGALTQQPGAPANLLSVQEVLLADDALGFTEEWRPRLNLEDLVKARLATARPVPFSEAVVILRSLAAALDFMIEQGRPTVFLLARDVWLTPIATDGNEVVLDAQKPLSEWLPQFSIMCLPDSTGQTAASNSSVQETLSASLQSTAMALHPVPAFAGLVYFLLSGNQVPPAAQFTASAYVPIASLKSISNQLLRDLICRQDGWTHVTSVLRDLCVHEGVLWQSIAPSVSSQRASITGSHSPSGTGSNAHPSTNAASNAASEGTPVERVQAERVCEVIAPGIVYSPYDPERRRQELTPGEWVPAGRVRCQFTQRIFRLPRKLEMLRARVIAPGSIQSPYAAPDAPQTVPWGDWVAGGEIVCAESGRRITLPPVLPMPDGILVPHRPGMIISPFDGVTQINVRPDRWDAGASQQCPTTGLYFLLPKELPPLEAVADINQPGVLASPYAPEVTWSIDPPFWTSQTEIHCPATQKRLRLPKLVERWPAKAELIDASRRLVRNPFQPETPLLVPATLWKPEAAVTCPFTGRTVLLPAELPLLVGEITAGQVGMVRSPYSGEAISLSPKDWVPGLVLNCPQTHLRFLLPNHLPEWIPTIQVGALSPGTIRSPFGSQTEIKVLPEQWLPGQLLKCPETGRSFRLPLELPLLEGSVLAARPGKVVSPFTGEAQDVSLDEWQGGQRIECASSRRQFVLPAVIPEWLVDGEWVMQCPGRIRSPFHPYPEIDLSSEQWRPRQVLTCPVSGRRFRAPITDTFPSLALEKGAVDQAWANPKASEEEAAAILNRSHRGATAETVLDIWTRHGLETVEKRVRNMQLAEILADEPGVVRSPYGSRVRVEVPPPLWAESDASILCPETGKRFLLPETRPLLFAKLLPGAVGSVISPYRTEEPFRVSPDMWQPGHAITCQHTGLRLRMPLELPEWLPDGTLKAEHPGVVFSPYGRNGAVRVVGANWYGGAPVTCLETGRAFVLPPDVPPLVAAVDEKQVGLAYSPYARDRGLRVPHRLWKPGAHILCPTTKRIFLLPDQLPEWKRRSTPWKPLVSAAAVVAILAGGVWLAVQHLHKPVQHSQDPVIVLTSDPFVFPQRVAFTGGLEIEDWPAKGPYPKGMRLLSKNGESPVEWKDNQFTAPLPKGEDDDLSGLELRLPGWKPLKVEVPAAAKEPLFETSSTSSLPGAVDLGSYARSLISVSDRKHFERDRVALPASAIPERGTDYAVLEALWVGPLSNEREATPPSTNPIRLPIAKGQLERPLPTGIYDFRLLGSNSDKVEIVPQILRAGVPISSASSPFLTLPPSLAGQFVGLLFTVKDAEKRLGYFASFTLPPKLTPMKAMVNPLAIKGGEVISPASVRPEMDELGTVEHLKLKDPVTLEFDAPLRMFTYHWTMKVDEGGNRFVYGNVVEFKPGELDREKQRMEQLFREKARLAGTPSLAAERLSRITPDLYRNYYGQNLSDAVQQAQYLKAHYPDMKVKDSSLYFALHPSTETVRVVALKNGDWDLQRDAK